MNKQQLARRPKLIINKKSEEPQGENQKTFKKFSLKQERLTDLLH